MLHNNKNLEKEFYPGDKELQVESSILKLGDRLLHVAKADVLELQGNTKVKKCCSTQSA
jgi:hypothetical protein